VVVVGVGLHVDHVDIVVSTQTILVCIMFGTCYSIMEFSKWITAIEFLCVR
jgi:hypothetical protein